MKKLTLIFVLFSLPFFVFSQDTLETINIATPPVTPDILAQLFPGEGVEVVDWEFIGDPISVGVFFGGEDAIGIEHGIALTTGRLSNDSSATSGFGANGIGNQLASYNNNGAYGDPDILSLSQLAWNYDNAILKITFIPLGDEMNFEFVFASEEYPEYVGSQFNDAFGFFVSGPGIDGPFSDGAENIALVPGTNDFISINSVNIDSNAIYYSSNFPSINQPVYDGILDVISSNIEVVPFETYTLKLVIADGGDATFDSAIFLKAESFETCCDSLISNVSEAEYNPFVERDMAYPVNFDLSNLPPWAFPISTTISGTAELGADFEIAGLPSSIPASEAQIEMELQVLQDSENEQVEYFKIEFETQGGFTFPYFFHIGNGVAIPLDDHHLCDDQAEVVLSAEIPVSNEIYLFEKTEDAFFDNSLSSEIEVNGVPAELLTDANFIESVCLNIDHSFISDLDLYLKAPNGSIIRLSTDNGGDCDNYSNTCFSPSANDPIWDALPPDSECGSGGMAPSTGTFRAEDNWKWLEDTPVNGTWTLVAVDDAFGFDGVFKDWSITFDTENIFSNPTYLWSTGETTPEITVSPTETTTYSVSITYAGQTIVEETTVSTDLEIVNLNIQSSCDNQFFTVSFEIMGGDPTSYSVQPFGSGTLAGNVFTSEQIACGNNYFFSVSDASGCGNVEVSGTLQCECSSQTGQMDMTPVSACNGTTVFADYNLVGQVYDCDDITSFILHSGNLVPIAVSNEPNFDLDGLTPGETYFVTAVVGNDDGAGFVDLDDPCLDFSEDKPVTILQSPTAQILTESDSSCQGEIFNIEIALTGQPPWSMVSFNNGFQIEANDIMETPFILPSQANSTFTLELGTVTDAQCTADAEGSITVEILPSPSVEISADSIVCPSTVGAVQIEFLGEAPYFIAYELNGTLFFDSVPGNLFELENALVENTEFTLLSTLAANGCTLGSQPSVAVEVVPPPNGSADFNGPLCPGFDLELSAEGGGQFDWEGPDGFESEIPMPTIENITEDNVGEYSVVVTNACGDSDLVTLNVAFDCTSFQDTVLVGETGEICFDEIISSADLCDPVSAISVEVNGNCLSFTGLSEGIETVCLQVVLDGQETAVTVEVTSQIFTWVNDFETTPSLNIYPNPASETIWVSWKNTQVEQVKILDLTGRRMGILVTAGNPFEVPLFDLPEGSYLVRCHTTDGILVEKFVVLGK